MRAVMCGGTGLLVLYAALIAFADAITKNNAATYAAPQLFAVSGAVVCLLCVIAARWAPASRQAMRTRCPRAMALRSAMTVVAGIFFFLAFRHLPFADVFLFVGMMPIFAGLVAWPILGETVSPVAWVALAIGFLGVLCLFPEGISGIGFGHLVAFLAALSGTVSIVLSRYIARYEDNALAQVFWPNLAFAVTMGAVLPFVWLPMPLVDLGWAVVYAVLLFSARWLLVLGLRELPAHAATSLMKLQFVWMVVLGAVIFGEWPAMNTYVGAVIVICSGLYLAYEAQVQKVLTRRPARGAA